MRENFVTRYGDTGGGLPRRVDAASSTVHHPIEGATNAAAPVADRFAAGARQAADGLVLAVNRAAASLESAAEQLKATRARLMDSSGSYVREKPGSVLGIAAASGFLLGILAMGHQASPD